MNDKDRKGKKYLKIAFITFLALGMVIVTASVSVTADEPDEERDVERAPISGPEPPTVTPPIEPPQPRPPIKQPHPHAHVHYI